MKNRIKKVMSVALIATMTLSMCVTGNAAIIGNDDGYYITDHQDVSFPCWIWNRGYCYYYGSDKKMLKNCTTPDGYTVDEQGRWTENGVAQRSDYGSVKMGTDVYNGKSDDEIWNLITDKVEPVFAAGTSISSAQYGYRDNSHGSIVYDIGEGASQGYEIFIGNNVNDVTTAGKTQLFVYASFGNQWPDQVDLWSGSLAYELKSKAESAALKEKVIKALVGDNVGQELFDYVAAHADKWSEEEGYVAALDENGNRIKGYYEEIFDENNYFVEKIFHEDANGWDWKMEKVSSYPDGMSSDTLDLSAWQNRTTDYGKTFSVSYEKGTGLVIKIY